MAGRRCPLISFHLPLIWQVLVQVTPDVTPLVSSVDQPLSPPLNQDLMDPSLLPRKSSPLAKGHNVRQLESNRRAASAGVEPKGRVSWSRTGGPRQLESNRRAASARALSVDLFFDLAAEPTSRFGS